MENQDYNERGQIGARPGEGVSDLKDRGLDADEATRWVDAGMGLRSGDYIESGNIETNLLEAGGKEDRSVFEDRMGSDPEVRRDAEKTEIVMESLGLAFQFPPQLGVKRGIFNSLGLGNPFF